MTVREMLQLLGIPLPIGVVVIVVIFTILFVIFNRFLDKMESGEISKKEMAPVNIAAAAPETGNSSIIVAISAAVSEYRKNNL